MNSIAEIFNRELCLPFRFISFFGAGMLSTSTLLCKHPPNAYLFRANNYLMVSYFARHQVQYYEFI